MGNHLLRREIIKRSFLLYLPFLFYSFAILAVDYYIFDLLNSLNLAITILLTFLAAEKRSKKEKCWLESLRKHPRFYLYGTSEMAKKFNIPEPELRINHNPGYLNLEACGNIILVGSGLRNILNDKELLALIGHEMSHIKSKIRNDVYDLTLFARNLILCGSFLCWPDAPFYSALAIMSVLMSDGPLFYFILWQDEYLSDLNGVFYSGKIKPFISGLTNFELKVEKLSKRTGFTHPPLSSRIKLIEKLTSV